MQGGEVEELFRKGVKAIHNGDTLSALACFEKVLQIEDSPVVSSYLAYCIAKERGQVSMAISLCDDAIKKEPRNSVHYFNLGKIYLVCNKKTEAVEVFRKGLSCEMNQHIVDELHWLGLRKPPVMPFLKRSNPINKYLGIILTKLRFR